MNCIYLFTNYWPSIAMRAPLFFCVLDCFDYHCPEEMGLGQTYLLGQCFLFSFLKDGVGLNNSFLRGGWHAERTEFESWNCIGSDHNIWLRIMVTHGRCKRQFKGKYIISNRNVIFKLMGSKKSRKGKSNLK